MTGYTPLHSTVLDGTLYGKWPHNGIWALLLSQCDKHGNIDMVPQLLAAKIGCELSLLMSAIADFMAPDPGSRSVLNDGRRLEWIDKDAETRGWGWHVINHGLYREKARKASRAAEEVASGRNAERMRERREKQATGEDPRRPASTLSQTQTQTQTKSQRDGAQSRSSRRCPADFSPDLVYAKSQIPDINAEEEAAKFKDYEFAKPRSDWPAAWRNWIRRCKERGEYARTPKSTAANGPETPRWA
jgi:hypothetical protein